MGESSIAEGHLQSNADIYYIDIFV